MTIAAAKPKTKRNAPRKSRPSKNVSDAARPMTYEEYLATPEEMARYDIIDGVKKYRLYGEQKMPSPTRRNQRIQGNLFIPFRAFEQMQTKGQVIQPSCDVLVARTPRLRTRQPDMLFITNERWEANAAPDSAAPFSPAPELVVEILSPSDTRRVQTAKLADYAGVGVQECWFISSEAETVEVLALSPDTEPVTVGLYGQGQTVQSVVFPGLSVVVADFFAV